MIVKKMNANLSNRLAKYGPASFIFMALLTSFQIYLQDFLIDDSWMTSKQLITPYSIEF